MNSYRKMPDGTWGIACDDAQQPGDVVTVTKRDGSTKQETLGKLIFDGVPAAYAIAPKQLATSNVGTMTGVQALFNEAKKHLKFPAVELSVPAADMTVRLSIAGNAAKVPGSITVLTADRNNETGKRDWVGRIRTDGTFECSPRVNGKEPAITARLQEFANDPARVAAEHGKLTAICCFCRVPLGRGKDKRSVAVGYGPDCAKHYGLPWGK